jgi:hypothetical protein
MNEVRKYHVAPRYTCGSPALVDAKTAHGVAQDELRGYSYALTGIYGPSWKARALCEGLQGIVEWHTVFSYHIKYIDLLTGDEGIRKQGKQTITGFRGDLIIKREGA